MKLFLHVGCGRQSKEILPPLDWKNEWREVRVDIDPGVEPDIVDNIHTLSRIDDGSAHCVFSKHNLEHVERHEVMPCLENFYRVLDDRGLLIIRTPDLESICKSVLDAGPEKTLYTATVQGESFGVTALDMLFGASWEIARGNHFMAHRTAFTAASLKEKLQAAGFEDVEVSSKSGELRARALRKSANNVYWEMTGRMTPGGSRSGGSGRQAALSPASSA